MPREKLKTEGLDSLNLQELLAIVLNTGTRKENVFELSSRLVKEYGGPALASRKSPDSVVRVFDLPFVKACQIVSLFEIGRRFFMARRGALPELRRPSDAYKHLEFLRNAKKEQFVGLYLNTRNRLIYQEVLSIGSLDSSIIHPREVFAPALEYRASRIIVAHNHPSGDLKPSEADFELTKTLIEAGKLLRIPITDHLIITENGYKSLI